MGFALPTETDCLLLFEQEPELLDAGVGRGYNTLSYSLSLSGGILKCTLIPGYGEAELLFEAMPEQNVHLKLRHVETMRADRDFFELHQSGLVFRVQLRPRFELQVRDEGPVE